MVRLKGPSLASQATGSLADTMIFSNWKGRSYLKKWSKTGNPSTSDQVAIRAVTRFCTQHFDDLDAADLATWEALAQSRRIAVFNAFIGESIRLWRDRKPPSRQYPRADAGSGGSIKNRSIAQQGRHAILTWEADVYADNWGYIINHSTTGYPGYAWNELLLMVRGGNKVVLNYPTPILPLGTNYFRINSFSVYGHFSGIGNSLAITMV
jgi:hypothetical protein